MPKFLFVGVIAIALYASYSISLHGGFGGFLAGMFVGVCATLFLQRTRVPQNATQQPTTAVQVNTSDSLTPETIALLDAIVERRINGTVRNQVRAMLTDGDDE